jgi:hypothetical protein
MPRKKLVFTVGLHLLENTTSLTRSRYLGSVRVGRVGDT